MFLTVRETATQLHVSAACVYQLVETGKLACHRIGIGRGAIRISQSDLDEFLVGCHSPTKTAEPLKTPPRVKLKHLRL